MYEMTNKERYALKEYCATKVSSLKAKYEPFYEAYKQYSDDRCLVPDIIDKLVDGCKALDGIGDITARVAYSRYFRAEEAKAESIVCRFENMCYENHKWNRNQMRMDAND